MATCSYMSCLWLESRVSKRKVNANHNAYRIAWILLSHALPCVQPPWFHLAMTSPGAAPSTVQEA
jgi:hypothetical protein